MRTIWKHKLNMGLTTLILPMGSRPLHVAMRGGDMHLWVEQEATHDPPHTEHIYFVIGTGHPLPKDYARIIHIGSVFDGPDVWPIRHVYRGIM